MLSGHTPRFSGRESVALDSGCTTFVSNSNAPRMAIGEWDPRQENCCPINCFVMKCDERRSRVHFLHQMLYLRNAVAGFRQKGSPLHVRRDSPNQTRGWHTTWSEAVSCCSSSVQVHWKSPMGTLIFKPNWPRNWPGRAAQSKFETRLKPPLLQGKNPRVWLLG